MSERSDTSTHGGELLSALLDGELGPAEREAVVAHVTGCGDCAGELAALRAARLSLRSLPAVDPPHGSLIGLVPSRAAIRSRPRRRPAGRGAIRGVMLQMAAAAAAALFVVAGTGPAHPASVDAQVGGAVDRHAAAAMQVGLGGSSLVPAPVTPTTEASRRVDELTAPFVAPAELAGYRRIGVFRAEGGIQVLYRRGGNGLSLFEEAGRLDLASLPVDGSTIEVDGATAWRWDNLRAAGRVVVVGWGGLVVTIVGDESPEAILAAARALPGPAGPGFGDRLRAACASALRLLGPAPD